MASRNSAYPVRIVDFGQYGQRIAQPHHVGVGPEERVPTFQNCLENVWSNEDFRLEYIISKCPGFCCVRHNLVSRLTLTMLRVENGYSCRKSEGATGLSKQSLCVYVCLCMCACGWPPTGCSCQSCLWSVERGNRCLASVRAFKNLVSRDSFPYYPVPRVSPPILHTTRAESGA